MWARIVLSLRIVAAAWVGLVVVVAALQASGFVPELPKLEPWAWALSGVNYAVTADGRNLARGHWARVHDQPGVVTTTGTPGVGQRDLYDLDLDGTFETVFVTPPTTGTIVNRTIDPDLHQPYVQEWGAGYSRQLPRGLAPDRPWIASRGGTAS